MNIKVVNNYLNEISIPNCDLEVIDLYFSRMFNILNDNELKILPTDKLNTGLFFINDGFHGNKSVVYNITSNCIELKDSNCSFGDFLKEEYKNNYHDFLTFTKDMLEIKPHFLNQHINTKFFNICISERYEDSCIKMYYYKRLTDKNIHLSIPLLSILNGDKDNYRVIILTSLYNEYKSQFSEFFTVEDFVDYAEDVFLQNTMIDY